MQPQAPLAPAALRGLAFGVFFMTAFAFVWSALAAYFLRRMGWQTWLVISIITVALCFGAERQLERAGQLHQRPPEPSSVAVGRQFRAVLIAENTAVLLAILVLAKMGRRDLIVSAIALIVGIHFFPLARIFGMRLYYASGAAIVGASLLAMRIRVPNLRQGITCAACGLVLWMTSATMLL